MRARSRHGHTRAAALAVAIVLAARTTPAQVVVEEMPGSVALRNGDVTARFDLALGALVVEALGARLGPLTPEARVGSVRVSAPGDAAPSYRIDDLADGLGRGKALTVFGRTAGHALETRIAVREASPMVTVEMTAIPATADRIASFALAGSDAAVEGLGGPLVVLAEAYQSWDIPPLSPRSASPPGEGLVAVHAAGTGLTTVLGALTQRERATAAVASGVRLAVDGPRSPATPGARIGSDVLALTLAPGPSLALETHAGAEATLAGAAPPAAPPWGWVSWYALIRIDENEIARAGAELAAIDGGRGEGVVLTDDGWQDRLGDWQPGAGFPAGMAALAADAHGRRLRAGLWVAPFGVAEGSRPALDHPEWLVVDSTGAPVVVENRAPWGGRIYLLDPSVPGVSQYLAGLMVRLTTVWGFDLVKLDFLYWGLVADHLARPGSDPRDAFRAALAAMRAATRPGTTVLLSGMPLAFAPGQGDAVRSGPDAAVDPERNLIVEHASARRAFKNGASYHADADALILRGGLGENEARRRATFQAMVGGPVFLGDALHLESAATKALAERLIPPHAHRGRALDLFTSDLPERFELALPGEVRLLAGLDASDATAERILPVSGTGAIAPRVHLVYDVWADAFLGAFAAPAVLRVAPSDAALVAVRPADAEPGVIATSAHLAGSAASVASAGWTPPDLALAIRGKPATTLRLVLTHPADLTPAATSAGALHDRSDGLCELEIALDPSGAAAATVTFATHPAGPAPPIGRPQVVAPPGVRVVGEEQIASPADLAALLADAATGTFVVVLPPPEPAPAPARLDPAPWVELTAPVTTAAAPGSLAGEVAAILGLPPADGSSVLLNPRAGVEPEPLLHGAALDRATHLVVTSGRGLLLRLGRLDDAVAALAIARLGDEPTRVALRLRLGEALRLRRLLRESQSLDGDWRFRTDPGGTGVANGWARDDFDDSAWPVVAVPGSWEAAGYPGYDGIAWYRRRPFVPRDWAGLDLALELGAVDDDDATSFAGQPAGTTAGATAPRRYRLPAALVRPGGENTIAIQVSDRGGDGGLLRPARLLPEPTALAAALHGGGLIAFRDAADVVPALDRTVLHAVKEGAGVRLAVSGGAAPFAIERGDLDLPPPGGWQPIAPASPARSLRDGAPPPRAAYRVTP